MSKDIKIRWGWLKFMYIYTIVGAGGFGLGIIFVPNIMESVFRYPSQDPILFGIVGCIYVSFGILSLLGLRSPLKFVPILLVELCYKSIWFIGVLIPYLIGKGFPFYAIVFAVIFATYIIGNLIAIPFSNVFSREINQLIKIQQ